MSIHEIISDCIELNIRLSKQQDNLKIDAPKGAMAPQLLAAIKDHKGELLDLLHRYGTSQQEQTLSRVYPEQTEGLMSSGQSQMWFLSRMFKDNENYQFYRILHLDGAIDTETLHQAFNQIIERHTILRTTYHLTKKAAVQRIGDGRGFTVEQLNLSDVDATEQQHKIADAAKRFKQSSFDLEKDLMLRVLLIKTEAQRYQLHLKLHHIATDGWSIALIVKEFTDIYNALINGEAPERNEAFQYIDYAQWQQSAATKENIKQHLSFFDDYLADAPEIHNLPVNSAKRTDLANAALVQKTLPADLTTALKAFCQEHNVTVFSFIQFGLSILVSRYSERQDTIMGTPMANRPLNELGKVIGFFVNTLPLRTRIDPEQSFIAALKTQHLNLLDVMEKQIVPFGEIVQRNVKNRQPGVSPLAQVMFSLQNEDVPTLKLGEAVIGVETPKTDSTDFDLSIKCFDENGEIIANWIYAQGLLEHEFIEKMATQLNSLVALALEQPQRCIGSLTA